MNESCIECSIIGGCPFSFTEESEQIQNYGCLPTPRDIIHMRQAHGKSWACHSNPAKPCLGAIEWMKQHDLESKVIDTKLVTLDDDWGELCEKQTVFKIKN